jgi:hypothetical protein
MIGPLGISQTVRSLIDKISKFQTGFVYHYALIMLLGLITFVGLISL